MSCSNTTARVRHFPTGRGEITLPNDVLEFALPGNPAFGALVKSIEARHGDSLVTIAMHVDEPQVHLHALFDNEGKNVKPLTEGPAAAAAAKAKGVNGRALRDAHDNAWRAVQDDFQEKVGRHVGLAAKA